MAEQAETMAEPSPGLVSAAIQAITQHIRSEGLGPGDPLPSEAAMTRQLNVSRTVVREAFRSLSAMRLIDMSAGRRATRCQAGHRRDVDGDRARHHHAADQRPADL